MNYLCDDKNIGETQIVQRMAELVKRNSSGLAESLVHLINIIIDSYSQLEVPSVSSLLRIIHPLYHLYFDLPYHLYILYHLY